MQGFLVSAAVGAALIAAASAAQASPAAPRVAQANGDLVQVRGLCGLGWHRGYYGECRPNGTGYGPYPYGWYGPYRAPAARCWWVAGPYGARRVCGW